jgi:hypothetical protein
LIELFYEECKFDLVKNLLNCKDKLSETEGKIKKLVYSILNKRNNFIINV